MSLNTTETGKCLTDNPELLNTDPYGAGWICKIETSMDGDLIGEGPYVTHIETLRAVSKDVEKSDAEIFDQVWLHQRKWKKRSMNRIRTGGSFFF